MWNYYNWCERESEITITGMREGDINIASVRDAITIARTSEGRLEGHAKGVCSVSS